MNELSLEKKAKVLEAFKTMYQSSKKGVKDAAWSKRKAVSDFGRHVRYRSVPRAGTAAKNKYRSSKKAVEDFAGKVKGDNIGTALLTRSPEKFEKAIATSSKARKQLAVGVTGAVITAAALRAAMKSGSKTTLSSLTKRQKLIKALKKNPKTTAAIGAGSGVGLAALLS
jgi:hypothetical protein